MTVREKIEQHLQERGLLQSITPKVMDYIMPIVDAEMTADNQQALSWERASDYYETPFYVALFLTYINRHVLAWAEANMPNAWWKPMFLPADERREAIFARAGVVFNQ